MNDRERNYNIRMSNLLTVFGAFHFFFFFFFFFFFIFSVFSCWSVLFFLYLPVCCIFLCSFPLSLHIFLYFRVSFVLEVLHSVSDSLLVSLLFSRFKIIIGRFFDRLGQLRFDTTPCGRELALGTKFYYVVYRNTSARIHIEIYAGT